MYALVFKLYLYLILQHAFIRQLELAELAILMGHVLSGPTRVHCLHTHDHYVCIISCFLFVHAFTISPSLLSQTHHMQCTDSNADFSGVVCSTFDDVHPMAMALSVLVTIEMLNAFNRYGTHIKINI